MSPFALCYFLANWDGNLSANAECFHLFFFLSNCSEYLYFFTNCFIDQWMMILEMLIHCCLDRDITVGRLFSQSSLPSSILHYVTVQILLFGKAWSQKKFGVILEHIEELHAFVEDQFCIFFSRIWTAFIWWLLTHICIIQCTCVLISVISISI